jgi:protein-L-isoaspartate(D-aspartate) O-methyltransferase
MDRDFTQLRLQMVERDLVSRGITNPRVLDAMRTVPRHLFVTAGEVRNAYDDEALPLPENQSISQPYIVALMAERANLAPTDHVLEVGAGSGYAAAVFSLLCEVVYTIERHPRLAEHAGKVLAGYPNVHVRCGDGTLGWPEHAPFNAILCAAASPKPPQALLEQLTQGGRLVMPLGDEGDQKLVRIIRTGPLNFTQEPLISVRFVPLIGAAAGR